MSKLEDVFLLTSAGSADASLKNTHGFASRNAFPDARITREARNTRSAATFDTMMNGKMLNRRAILFHVAR